MEYNDSDKRFLALNELFVSYSLGDFDAKAEMSPQLDEVDTIISGVNMLGEELKVTTISRDFFSNVFNSVTEILFVLNEQGEVVDVNDAVFELTGLSKREVLGSRVAAYFAEDKRSFFKKIKTFASSETKNNFESLLHRDSGERVPVLCTCSVIKNRSKKAPGFLFVVRDITERKNTEQLVLRAIVDTQEQERKRVANDLHDSLGQELSAIKLVITSLKQNLSAKQLEALENCTSLLDGAIHNLRGICYDLLPPVLEQFGVDRALRELFGNFAKQSLINFHYSCNEPGVRFNLELDVVVFRLVQEFVNNSIKHADASNIWLTLENKSNTLRVNIADDGKGFVVEDRFGLGKGLQNMHSRIQAFEGDYRLESAPGKGTNLWVEFIKKA